MKWWNDGNINKRSHETPGPEFKLGRISFKRVSPTQETRLKMSLSNTGKPSPFKGISRGPESDEIRAKKSMAAYLRDNSVYKGRTPWCKGLDVSDPRVAKIRDSQIGQKRTGNYACGENHPSYNPDRREYLRYKTKVQRLTEQTYAAYHKEINPYGLPRTLAGVEGGYQLDHITSTWKGFTQNINPDIIASKENLQMLPWLDNLKKSKD